MLNIISKIQPLKMPLPIILGVALAAGTLITVSAQAQTSFTEMLEKQTSAREADGEDSAEEKAEEKADDKADEKADVKADAKSKNEDRQKMASKSAKKKKAKKAAVKKAEEIIKKVAEAEAPTRDEPEAQLILKTAAGCYVVEFESPSGELISCQKPLALKYTRRNCEDSKETESAKSQAFVNCEDDKHFGIRFKTTQGVIYGSLKVARTSDGKKGSKAFYVVEKANLDQVSFEDMMPEPEMIKRNQQTPEEAEFKKKISGFIWVETESSKNFGYNSAGSNNEQAIPDFDSNQPTQSLQTLFSNLTFEFSKDRSALVGTFQIGEVQFGDQLSGGQQGANKTILKVRNLYLDQSVIEGLNLKAGIITTNSDPRGFIFSDHLASLQAEYKTDLIEGLLWSGKASQERPGYDHNAGGAVAKNDYFGAHFHKGFLSHLKTHAYYVAQKTSGAEISDGTSSLGFGNATNHWAGLTVDFEGYDPMSAQATYISNWGETKLTGESSKYNASLADLKVGYNSENWSVVAEGLMTSGSDDGYLGGVEIKDKAKNFHSPINSSYLLTVATSDGADDAPGSTKRSTIGGLSSADGLQLGVLTLNWNYSKKTTAFIRQGSLQSAVKNSATNSNKIGDETDLGIVHQVTPSSTLQLDYGYFKPGDYFTSKDAAELLTLRLKFTL